MPWAGRCLQIAGFVQSTLVFFDLGAHQRPTAHTAHFLAGQSRRSQLRSFAGAREIYPQSYWIAADTLLFCSQAAHRVAGQPGVACTTGEWRIAGWHLGYFSDLAMDRRQTSCYRCIHGGAHFAHGHPAAAMVARTLGSVWATGAYPAP